MGNSAEADASRKKKEEEGEEEAKKKRDEVSEDIVQKFKSTVIVSGAILAVAGAVIVVSNKFRENQGPPTAK